MHQRDETPFLAAHSLAVLRGSFFAHPPVIGVVFQGFVVGAADRQHAETVLTGGQGAGGRPCTSHRHFRMRHRVGRYLQMRVLRLEPIGLHRDGIAFHQFNNDIERFVHHAALRFRINSHPVGVPDQGAGPDTQHKAATRHVIELCRTAGHHERMMVGQRDHTGAELDIFRPFRSAGDKHFRTRDDLEPARMVLADPGFRVTQFVEIFEQPHIPLHRLRWVLLQIMEGR